MDIRELQLFLKLSETLHYTKTSHIMAISPSALSRTIQRMEDQVGQKLFYRDNRGVILTPSGERFRDYALSVLGQWEQLQNDLSEKGESPKGDLIIYSSVTGCYTVLPELLKRCGDEFPDIHIKLKTGSAEDSIAMILSGEAHLAVAAEPDALPESLTFLNVLPTPLQLIAPSQDCLINDRLKMTGGLWEGLPLILPEKGIARKRIDRYLSKKGLSPEIYAEADGNEAILAMVSLGFGVGLIPSLVREQSLFQDRIRVLPSPPELEAYNVGLCMSRKSFRLPIIQAFTSLIESSATASKTESEE